MTFTRGRRFSTRRNFQRNRFSRPAKRGDFTLSKIMNDIGNKPPADTLVTDTYVSRHRFEDFPLSPELKQNIIAKHYVTPTSIQDQAIGPILEGRDVIGIANTGTGKTAAFLLPLIDKVFKNNQETVLIVTPTRELALQINEELRDFSRGMGIRSALCTGGMNSGRQEFELRRGPQFVIGTPGRLKDLIKENILNLSGCTNVVLDEADRMVDIGFINDIKYFISLLPQKRQSLFFSATISDQVKEVLSAFVRDPITISVKHQDSIAAIDQNVVKVVNKQKKVDQLHEILNKEGFDKVLIFGRTKWSVQKLADELVVRGFKAGAIHGNKRQSQRQRTLDMFKRNEINILLATDVASRGLDIQDISHVINYDLPGSYDDYIHRIGRTGRANKKGSALTFVE